MTRAERYMQVKALRDQGLTIRKISERLGVAKSTVSDVLCDPTGDIARERKRRYERNCVGCGKTINPNGIRSETTRCQTCAGAHSRELTRAWIGQSMKEWADLFGAPPSSFDWNQSAIKARGFEGSRWRIERYERTGRPWPATSTVVLNFGTWNAALRAAGFEPLAQADFWLGHMGVALRKAA